MKKVLALVLAVMMMATVAFATTADNVVDKENTVNFGGQMAPGDTLYVYRGMKTIDEVLGNPVDSGDGWNADVTSTNYNIGSQKWTENKALLAGLEFDDKNNQLKINLAEDYTLKQPKRLVGSFVLKGKGKGGKDALGESEKPNTIKVNIDVTIGNWKHEVTGLDPDKDITLDGSDVDLDATSTPDGTTITGTDIYDNSVQKFKGENYGTVVLECADDKDTEVTFRAYKNDELFLFNNVKANTALLKAYADQDAEISFLNFVANPTLNSTATVRFYKDEASHVYIMKDGKLTSEVKWDDDEDCFLLKTRTLGSYVFSDKALPFNVEATGNPDTGANDVVGIATALAAVALVSAAAVSLKK